MRKVVVLKDPETKEIEPWRSPWTNPTTEELFKNGKMISFLFNGGVFSGAYQFWDGKVDTPMGKIHLTRTDGWVFGANPWLRYEKN